MPQEKGSDKMIVKTEAELNVARAFCSEPFHYFSISKIAEKAGISRTWAYKVLNKFRKFNMLVEERKSYRFNFSNIICKRLKLFFDSEFITSSKLGERIVSIAERIIYECKPASIVLIGSVAVGKERETSDMDFLVITGKKHVPLLKEDVNVILMSRSEFERKYLKGDDFIVSSLSFGKIVYDEEYFIKFYERPLPVFSSEVIQEKIDYCRKLRNRIVHLARSDVDSAKEELLNLALQCARIILLRNGIIPPTKHEIAHSIRKYNSDIAKILDNLMKNRKIDRKRIVEYLRVCEEII